MSRELKDWLSSYVRYASKTSEPPESYHWWVGVSVIAATLQRRCYLDEGFSRIYPNLYIVLVGPPGKTRKGTACEIGLDLLRKIDGIRLAPNSASRQALIGRMKESLAQFENSVTGEVEVHCSLTIYSEELSVFLGQGDIDLLSNLTNWYDSRSEFEYETIGRGKEVINGVCVNMIGATAPDWFSTTIPKEALGGGFCSRVIFIVEEEKSKIVSDPSLTIEQRQLQHLLITDLEKIKLLSGEFRMTEQAFEEYAKWYTHQSNNPPILSPHFQYYCSRRQTHLRKIMLVMSASRGDDHMITQQDFQRARLLLEKAEVKMPRAFSGMWRSKLSEMIEKVLTLLIKNGPMRKSDLIRTLFPDLDDYTCSLAINTLMAMKSVRIATLSSDPVYEWTGKGAN